LKTNLWSGITLRNFVIPLEMGEKLARNGFKEATRGQKASTTLRQYQGLMT
jgi:hypothetical protein